MAYTPTQKSHWKSFPTAKALVAEWLEKKDRAYECVAKMITPQAYKIAVGRTQDVDENITIKDQIDENVIDIESAFPDL